MLARLLDDVLDTLAGSQDWKQWWAWRLREHELLARAPQPEFDILRSLEDSRARHDQRSLAERLGRDPRRYWQAINSLWAIEAIHSPDDPENATWNAGSRFALTHRGRILLGRLRLLSVQSRA